jgi:signal peptidase II
MKRIYKYGILPVVLCALVGCDQVTKDIARRELSDGEPMSLLYGLVRLTYTENPGVFMGLGADMDAVVRLSVYIASSVAVAVSVILLCFYAGRLGRMRSFGLLLLLSGATGNLVDRFVNQGRVIDFMVLGIGQVHTAVFNLADVLITLGVVLIVVYSRRQGWGAA